MRGICDDETTGRPAGHAGAFGISRREQSMKRRSFLKMLGLAAGTALASPGVGCGSDEVRRAPRDPARKVNFLFLLTDDQRFNAFHAAGCQEIVTPAMDRLVAEGTLFAQATIMGGNSGAVCMPSRAMIMTGASLFHCQGVIPRDFVTLPQLLRHSGYATFATGKWHNGQESLLRSFEFGRAIFFGGMGDHFKTPVSDVAGGTLVNARTVAEFDAAVFAEAAVEFLRSRPKDKPFFAYVAFKTPHDPRVVPQKFHDLYRADQIPLPPNFLPEHPFDNGELKIRDELLAKFPRTPEEIQQHLAAYYAATTATDDQIGRVLRTLDEMGLADNTVVILAGDNGLAVGQHGLMGKQNLYEHSSRVPLILRGPGIPRGQRSAALCQLFDLYPTLAAQAGLPVPATVDGKDLGPVLRGEQADVRDATLHDYRGFQRAVRTHEAKLIEYRVKGARITQLFDLKNDPWETKNLAHDPAYASLLAQLRQRKTELEKEYGAPPLRDAADVNASPARAKKAKMPKAAKNE